MSSEEWFRPRRNRRFCGMVQLKIGGKILLNLQRVSGIMII